VGRVRRVFWPALMVLGLVRRWLAVVLAGARGLGGYVWLVVLGGVRGWWLVCVPGG